MSDNHFQVTIAQINTKRQWPKSVRRVRRMVRSAEKRGTTIITLNEISKEQVKAIQALPGWDIHFAINDRLRGNSWAGNAVAWKTRFWSKEWANADLVEIDYRRGKKFSPVKGRWGKKTIKFPCVKLTSVENDSHRVAIQSFHYPTKFNSNGRSRSACSLASENFAERQLEKDVAVGLGGDGNNIFPRLKGLFFNGREGPDGILTSGRTLRDETLPFKRRVLTDHNGVLVKVQFSVN